MSVMTNKAIVRRYVVAFWNRRNVAVAEVLVAAEYDAGVPSARGPDAERALLAFFIGAFPDFTITIQDLIAEEGRVVVRYLFAGTHRGAWMGFAPTDRRATIDGTTTYRLAGEKIIETWFSYDALGLLQ